MDFTQKQREYYGNDEFSLKMARLTHDFIHVFIVKFWHSRVDTTSFCCSIVV